MPQHETHIEQIHYSLRREMNEFYWAIAIKTFGTGLLGIFVPIYVFLFFEQSVILTFLFYGVQYLAHALLVPFAAKLIRKVGVKKLMAIGNPLLSAYILLLVLAPDHGLLFIILALLIKIIYLVIYWPSRNIDFARFSEGKKRGRQIGTANIIVALTKVLTPLTGGLLIVNLGFPALFAISAAIIAVSSVPLFFSPEVYESFSLSWRQSYRRIFTRKNRRASLAFFASGIEGMMTITAFPIFVFLVIGSFEVIGSITSLALLVGLVFTYIIGYLSDKKGSDRVLSFASVVHAFAWVINAFIRTPLQYIIYSSFFNLAQLSNRIPFATLFYSRAKKRGHGMDEYIIHREIVNNLGKAAVAAVVILGFWLGITNWLFYFAIAGGAALAYQFVVIPEQTTWSRIKSLFR